MPVAICQTRNGRKPPLTYALLLTALLCQIPNGALAQTSKSFHVASVSLNASAETISADVLLSAPAASVRLVLAHPLPAANGESARRLPVKERLIEHGERLYLRVSSTDATERNGIWSSAISRPVLGGEWRLFAEVTTAAGEETIVDTGRSFAGSVQDPQDTEPPTLGTSSLDPTSVDISTSEQTISAEAQLLDNDTGVGIVFFNLSHTVLERQVTAFASLVSGTATDGIWRADIRLPQFSAIGTWNFEVEAFDNAFNFADLATGLSVTATGNEDISPPTLSAAESLSPTSVDLSSGPATVTVTAPVQDDVSGASFVDVSLRQGEGDLFLGFADLISGTPTDGTWELAAIIQENTGEGTWTLVLRLGDAAGNSEEIVTTSTLTVSGGDGDGPALSGPASIDPTTVDVSTAPQLITVTVPLQDATGVAFNNDIILVKGFEDRFVFATSTLLSGSPQDGVWAIAGEVPTGTPNGTWDVIIEANDTVGNSSEVDTGVTLEVTGADVNPPQLVSSSVSPLIVDVSTGPAEVQISAVITDNQSGVTSVQVLWTQGLSVRFGGDIFLTEGDNLNGIWAGAGTVSTDIPVGVWGVSLLVEDASGNSALLETGKSIQVGGADTQSPRIAAPAMPLPQQVDVTTMSRPLTITVGLTDDATGVEEVRFVLEAVQTGSAAKSRETLLDQILVTASLASGTPNDGTWSGTTTIPRNARSGDWSIRVTAEDGAANVLTETSANVFVVVGGDDEPPALAGSAAVSNSAIDLSGGPVSVTVTAPLVDIRSGVSTVAIQLTRGADRRFIGSGTLISGTAQDGVWRIEGAVPQSIPAGAWNVLLDAADALGNRESLATGLFIEITGSDTNPPAVAAVSLDPGQVDVTATSADVDVEAFVTDNLSGVSVVSVLFRKGFSTLFGGSLSLSAGTSREGTWTGTATIGQGVEGGIYTVLMDVTDVAGNRRDIATSVVLLVGVSDFDAPVLAGSPLVSPGSVDVSAAPVPVSISVSVTDAEAGVAGVAFTVDAPATMLGKATIGPNTLSSVAELIAGDQNSGSWSADLIVPRNAEPGEWVLSVRADDRVGNILDVQTAQTLTVSGSDPDDPVYPGGGSLIPGSIDVTDGPQSVTVRVPLMDDGSGIGLVTLNVRGSDGSVRGSGAALLESGTAGDGAWKADVQVDADGGNYDVFVLAEDFAGNSISVQTDLVLNVAIQPPGVPTVVAPLVGERQVNQDALLSWSSRAARSNEVFVWRAGETPAAAPVVITEDQQTTVNLDSGTEYEWFVRVSNSNGTVDGPTWAFKTESLPDLVITDVSVASEQQVGQPLDIEWTVQNLGGAGTTVPVWHDAVVLSFDRVFDRRDTGLGRLPNASYLDPGESYTTTASFDVPANFVGVLYYILATDSDNRQNEIDETNNQSVGEIRFVAPPPSDLALISVGGPSNAFSGSLINLQWGVENVGTAVTNSDLWTDRIYLSPDSLLDLDTALLIREQAHEGVLVPSSEYSEQAEVMLPVDVFGSRWLVAQTDADDVVFEGVGESNNFRSRRIQIALTPPPDLVVQNVSIPAAAASGQSIEVSWTVKNEGATKTSGSWFDRVYLSASDTFDAESSTVLKTTASPGSLDATGEYRQTISATVPNGVQGDFFVFVVTDSRNQVFEHTFEDNNQSTAVPLEISLSPSPDLVIANLRVPTEVPRGGSFDISWVQANSGAGDARGPWTDQIVVSASPEWAPGSVLASFDLSEVRRDGILPEGKSKPVGSRAVMPPNLVGDVFIYVVSDAGNQVFEGDGEANNLTRSGRIALTAPGPADLSVLVTGSPVEARSGDEVEISWTVSNSGGLATGSAWRDAVYLSTDSELGDDILLGEAGRVSDLPTGQSYLRTRSFQIPHGVSGDYNLIVQADASSATSDANRDNNTDASNLVTITEVPPPNLSIGGLASSSTPISGQPIEISWTVRNTGVGATPGMRWHDAIYLSRDAKVDLKDIRIGSEERALALAAGSEYTVNRTVDIPVYWSGDGHLIVSTDVGTAIYEASEEDNSAFIAQTVARPLPTDLVVENVVADGSAEAGGVIGVSWDVSNVSRNPAKGRMTQGVYLSADQQWDSRDPLLGTVLTTVDLQPGINVRISASINLSLLGQGAPEDDFSGDVPGVLPGDYFVIIRTDNRNNIPESDDGNNTGVAATPTSVTIPNFALGGTALDQWSPGQVRYYCLTVAEGLDLRLVLESQDYASSSMYVAYDRVPTPVDYDVAVSDVASLAKTIVIPSTQTGPYYVLLRAPQRAATEADDFSFRAETLSFGVDEAIPASGGRGGFVTGRIRGAGFRDGGTAFLRAAGGGTEIAPAGIRFVSTVEAEVRWDLRGADLGRYDIVVRRPDGMVAVLPNGFEVERPTAPEIAVSRIVPRALLANRPEQYVILVTNASNNDIELATLQVDVGGNATIQVSTSGDFRSRTQVVPDSLKGAVPGLADVVVSEDGTVKSIPFVARDVAPGATSTIQITLFVPRGETEFPVRVTTRSFTQQAFIEELLTNLEAGRQLVLANPDEFAAATVDLARDAEEYARKHLSDASNLGLIDPGSIENALVTLPSIQRSVQTRQLALALSGAAGIEPLLSSGALLSCNEFFRATGCALAVFGCATAVTGVGAVLCVAGLVACATGWELAEGGFIGCLDPASALNCAAQELLCNPVVGSFDPNDILGPTGFGDERWIARQDLLGYTIRFENDPELATAPAREVRVTHPLDSLLDVRTFRLGAFGFGGFRFDVPEGSPTYTARLDLRDSLGLYVDVTAGIDITSRSAFWNLVSIDPGAGLSPENPFDGFLALNDSLGSGEGFVTYTIRPASVARTGDVIRAEARIVFDINEPIDTPVIFNTIDADVPSSRITIADPIDAGRWQVNWSADDLGSGLRDYRLYVSEDGINFAPYRAGIVDPTVVFAGEPNSRYQFYTVASDNAGNAEATKSEGEVGVAVEVAGEIPTEFALYQGYPNPFNPSLTVPFDVARSGDVEIRIFDVLGRLARVYDAGRLLPGRYEQQMNLGSFASGVYFYEIRVADAGRILFSTVMKAVLVK